MVAKSYLGYTHQEFWYEANPYEVMDQWKRYIKLNGWDKGKEEQVDKNKWASFDDL